MFMPVMLARPLPKNFEIQPGEWFAEEKYDGHRIEIEVAQGKASLFTNKGITAWSRYGLERKLPTHLLEELEHFPDGIYDGELMVPGKRSYGVTELTNTADLVYFMFDLLVLEGDEITPLNYVSRRHLLDLSFKSTGKKLESVRLAPYTKMDSWEHATTLRDEVWSAGGEGLILKRAHGTYEIGKRSKNLIKIKDLKSAVLRVVEFMPSKGQIIDGGPCAIALLEDEDGNRTSVRVRTEALRNQMAALGTGTNHPYIGRELRIEFQERTPDGNYRHPRWDRWEDE